MSRKSAGTELLRISEAVAHLEAGMYGSFNRPKNVEQAKKYFPGVSIGSGPRKEYAARIIDDAIRKNKLTVFVLADVKENEAHGIPLRVPADLLGKMIRTRGGLPDHVIQPERIFARDPLPPELRGALSKSALYLGREEFAAWYEEARKKRIWPSQRSSSKPRIGRPSRQSDLRARIVELAKDEKSFARQTIADLVRLLKTKGKRAERDTVRRLIDQLYRETGDPCYWRSVRKRARSQSTAGS